MLSKASLMELPFLSVQENYSLFLSRYLLFLGRHLSMPFSRIILLKRIFRVVVYYLVIKVLRVSLFSTAILDYHIFKRLSTAFLFFAVRFRSFISAALTCDSCDRISCKKLNVNPFIFEFFIFFLPRVIHTLSTSFPHKHPHFGDKNQLGRGFQKSRPHQSWPLHTFLLLVFFHHFFLPLFFLYFFY